MLGVGRMEKLNEIWTWYISCLKKYAVFKGRAGRKEFWSFILVYYIISIFIYAIGMVLIKTTGIFYIGTLLSLLYHLCLTIPNLSVTVRRLHDIGYNGFTILIVAIPFIGIIWLLVLLIKDSEPFENKYGQNPKTLYPENE